MGIVINMFRRVFGFFINYIPPESWTYYVKFVGIFFGIIAITSISLLLIIWRTNAKKKKLVTTNEK